MVIGLALTVTACSAGESSDKGSTAAGTSGCDSVDLNAKPAQPVKIRLGHGTAAEEPSWLLSVDDQLAAHKGSFYTIENKPFRGTAERLTAYQAGELDAVLISPQAQIRGTARQALDLYAIATIMREAEPGAFSTSFVAKQGAGITDVSGLKGKQIAIVDAGSQLDFLARVGVQKGGGNPERDAKYVVFPFPAQEQALRGGQIDVAGLPEPFFTLAMSKGGVVKVFDGGDVTDFAYDLLTVSFDRKFVEANLAAVCAWAADYRKAMTFWKTNQAAARDKLIGTPFVALPPAVYKRTGDYGRPDEGKVDTDGMQKMLDLMIQFKILTERDRIDPKKLVRAGVSIGH